MVLGGFPPATLDSPLTGTVVAVRRGGRTPIPAGGVVLQARGNARDTLLAEAPVGSTVTVRLRLADFPDGAPDGIGGGPVLVRNGVPVRQADELFSLDQIAGRHPRTAVGQLADGGFLFVVADGRSSWSYGLTQWTMARAMADLGAVTAMGLDGGGSSTIAFEGSVFNTPSDGRPRTVANGLFLFYYGVYAPALGQSVLSTNGDGVDDSKALSAKVVRPSDLSLRLLRPDGSVAWSRAEVVQPGWARRVVAGRTMPEGIWRWVAEATEIGSGQTSRMERTFRVNRTLGHLRLSRRVLRVRPAAGGRLGVSVQLTRRSRLVVAVLGGDGRPRRTLFRRRARAGREELALERARRRRAGRRHGRLHGARVGSQRSRGRLAAHRGAGPADTVQLESSRCTRSPRPSPARSGTTASMPSSSSCSSTPSCRRRVRLVMVYGGAVAAGAFAGSEVTFFGTAIESTAWAYFAIAMAGTIGYTLGSIAGWAIGLYCGRPYLEKTRAVAARRPARSSTGRTWWLERLRGRDRARDAHASRRPLLRLDPGGDRRDAVRPLHGLHLHRGRIPWCFGLAAIGVAARKPVGAFPRRLPLRGLRDHRAGRRRRRCARLPDVPPPRPQAGGRGAFRRGNRRVDWPAESLRRLRRSP